jgi:N-formylglutamate amidohydrolase
MTTVRVEEHDTPLILSLPHGGTELPDGLRRRLTDRARTLPDTDWHIDRLYAFAENLPVTTVAAVFSRYVIDVNRDPSGASLYPGRATTALCPLTTFAGEPLYLAGEEPDAHELEERRRTFFDAYHQALAEQIARVKAIHGVALLYDCHSIRSHVPRLFEGELPVLNLGTNDGKSCDPALCRGLEAAMAESPYSHVTDGRFKGGWITRHYGRPNDNVHAVQMELAQRAYMHEDPPYAYDHDKAQALQPTLLTLLEAMLDFGERR